MAIGCMEERGGEEVGMGRGSKEEEVGVGTAERRTRTGIIGEW